MMGLRTFTCLVVIPGCFQESSVEVIARIVFEIWRRVKRVERPLMNFPLQPRHRTTLTRNRMAIKSCIRIDNDVAGQWIRSGLAERHQGRHWISWYTKATSKPTSKDRHLKDDPMII